jgi:hypothetical protein
VAIPAVNAEAGDVMTVAEGDRLLYGDFLLGKIAGSNEFRPAPRHDPNGEDAPEKR